MRKLLASFLMLGLVGCGNVVEEVSEAESIAYVEESSKAVGKLLNANVIEEELSYIETLVGIDEYQAAKVALEDFLFELEGDIVDEEHTERIKQLEDVLSVIEVSEDTSHDHTFTAVDAVAIAMERYGTDDDIVYMYDETHEHYANDEIGYYVALRSIALQEQEGDRKSTRLNSSHRIASRMPSSA